MSSTVLCGARTRQCVNPKALSDTPNCKQSVLHRAVRAGLAARRRGDNVGAARHFARAAAAGDPEGQYLLGLSYARSRGVIGSLCDATVWLRKAAERGK